MKNTGFKLGILYAIVFILVAAQCAHAEVLLDDFAGLRKSTNPGPIWAPDPSRIFATPGGGGHEANASSMPAPVAAKTSKPGAEVKPESKPEDKPDTPTVKPEEKPKPPTIPTVKPPKDEPVKPECKPKPHKCWPFKFKPCAPKAKVKKQFPDLTAGEF